MSIRQEVLIHVLFWIAYMGIFTFVEGGYDHEFKEAFYFELAFFPFRLFTTYLNYFWLLPWFLLKRRFARYIIYSILSIIIASFLHRLLIHSYLSDLLFPGWERGDFWTMYKFLQSAMIITSPAIFIIGLAVMSRWVSSERKAEMLRNGKVKAELSYLRSQINPHFFFNTLNNLYGLALKKSDKTPEVVLKLSELMSYILYEADHDRIALSKEIDQIERYVGLEQIRYGNRFTVDMEVLGDIDALEIPPLLLLPFVENSFKHGVNKSSRDGAISIRIEMQERDFHFRVSNKVIANQRPPIDTSGHNGLGIANVRKRLMLLFPDKHDLNYHETEGEFIVNLHITDLA